jgi:hypothetical protein
MLVYGACFAEKYIHRPESMSHRPESIIHRLESIGHRPGSMRLPRGEIPHKNGIASWNLESLNY